MELTLHELAVLANYTESTENSLFTDLPPLKGKGSLQTLREKGLLNGDQIAEDQLELLDVLSKPERVAKFQLLQLEINMRKRVYQRGDRQILVEFQRDFAKIMPFAPEAPSIRTEISNHTGVSFTKHSQLSQSLTGHELLTTMALADWLRRVALKELLNESVDKQLTLDGLQRFMARPLKLGLLDQTMAMTHLAAPAKAQLDEALAGLQSKGLVESVSPHIDIAKSVILLAINFLVPNLTVSLELYDLTLSSRILTAREMIVQASPKDVLSFSAERQGYRVESITSGQVLDKAMAYLSCPSLAQSL